MSSWSSAGRSPTTMPRSSRKLGVAGVFAPGAPTAESSTSFAEPCPRERSSSTRQDAVAVVTIDRQEALNALNVETLTELRDRLRELAEDDTARVVVLTGAGESAFVAGADIKYMGGLEPGRGEGVGRARPRGRAPARGDAEADDRGDQRLCARRRLRARARLRHPLRLEQRPARPARDRPRHRPRLGRHAAARARLRPRRREGADPHGPHGRRGGGASHRPRQRRSPIPSSSTRSRSPESSRRRAPVALRVAKRLLNLSPGALEREAEEFGDLFASEDAKEGLAAFAEKRPPRFVDDRVLKKPIDRSPGWS